MTDSSQTSQNGGKSGLIIPQDLRQKYPDLLTLIEGSESMNNEERQYWINIMPIMTQDQLQNLRNILFNEKRQLAAIDKKYEKEIEQIGQSQLLKKTEQERLLRRKERRNAELEQAATETSAEEDLLRQIEEA